jgi:hypothetical protein
MIIMTNWAVLDADLQAEAAAPHAVECRVGPGAVAGAREQHAGATLAAEDEAGLEHARANHHRAGAPQRLSRVVRQVLADHVLDGQRGAIHQRLFVALRVRRVQPEPGQDGQGGCGEKDADHARLPKPRDAGAPDSQPAYYVRADSQRGL